MNLKLIVIMSAAFNLEKQGGNLEMQDGYLEGYLKYSGSAYVEV